MNKECYGVCTACNGHRWLVWARREGEDRLNPFIEPCKFCNSGDEPDSAALTRPEKFIVGGVEV